MKRVAMVHHTFPTLGGGERFVLSAVEALNSAGIVPDVFSRRPVDSGVLMRVFGKEPAFRYLRMRRHLPYSGERFILYRKYLDSLAFAPRGYDVVLNLAVGEFSPVRVDPNAGNQFLYVFNPFYEWPKPQHGIRSAYTKPYRYLVTSAVRNMKGRILVNSEFTARRVVALWGSKPRVLYSPIDVRHLVPPGAGHRAGVVNVGRFSPEKRQDLAIRVMSKVGQGGRLTLIGSAVSREAAVWLQRLTAFARTSHADVRFLPNLPFGRLRQELWRAKAYLHTFLEEDLGLAPLEAIAAGCVPVVPDGGGNVETVPVRELRYRSPDEAASKVVRALHGEYDSFLPELRTRLDAFSQERFKAELLQSLGLD